MGREREEREREKGREGVEIEDEREREGKRKGEKRKLPPTFFHSSFVVSPDFHNVRQNSISAANYEPKQNPTRRQ